MKRKTKIDVTPAEGGSVPAPKPRRMKGLRAALAVPLVAVGLIAGATAAQATSHTAEFDCQTSAGHWHLFLDYSGSAGHIVYGVDSYGQGAELNNDPNAIVYIQAYGRLSDGSTGWATKATKSPSTNWAVFADSYGGAAWFNTQTDGYANGGTGRMRMNVQNMTGPTTNCIDVEEVFAP